MVLLTKNKNKKSGCGATLYRGEGGQTATFISLFFFKKKSLHAYIYILWQQEEELHLPQHE